MGITIDINKAKEIAHNKRRVNRNNEFAPLDIKVTIPSESAKAEEERQKIREKYNVMQVEIDNATSVEQLKQIIS
jgi:hypothetical protein